MLVAAILGLSLLSFGAHVAPWIDVFAGVDTPTVSAPTTTTPAPPGGATSRSGSSSGSQTTSTGALTTPAVPAFDTACLRRDNPATGAKIPAGDPFGADITELGDKAQLQRLYAVQSGQLVALDGLGAPRPCDTQLFTLVAAVAPTLMPHLDELLIFDSNPNPQSGEWVIDGESSPKQTGTKTFDDDHWRLSFAPNGLDRSELAWLVAHELAHLASLNAEQMLSGIGRDYCATWYTGTGCLIEDSLLYRYLRNTWPDDVFKAWDDADATSSTKARTAAIDTFYEAHKDNFVTRYAASHPFEDFAESFAMWCSTPPTARERKALPKGKDSDSGSKVEWFSAAKRDVLPAYSAGCAMLQKFAVG